MLELGVIADDLTGGMMVASLLEREGVSCPLVTSADALARLDSEAQAVVIGRKIRLQAAPEAVADARLCGEALLDKGVKRIYYKYSALFMSTDEGNIGPVSEALMALTGSDRVLFCPTWRGATVYLGRLFVNDKLIHETAVSRDPATPMKNANLVEVLQAQSRVKTRLLPRRVLRSGIAAAQAHLAEAVAEGAAFFIVDAIEEGDVELAAGLVADSPLSTGADWLPIFLARNWQGEAARSEPKTLLPPAPGSEAVLAGSCSPKTNRQLKLFEADHELFRVDLVQAADDPDIVDRIIEWAAARLDKGPVGIATTTDHDGVERAQKVLGREGAAGLAEDILGRVTTRLYELGVRKFVVAGGETSGTVIDRLGIDQLRFSSFEELGGGYCHADGGISLVTKAGGAGEEDFFLAALLRMQEADRAGVS